eukprot:GILK01007555.1.p1 GENE.GILK01007555.1~~GILK01007555.1.p1  ORF type:complete len:1058 (-),score=212.21 GILK01007555.1:108-3281(-)
MALSFCSMAGVLLFLAASAVHAAPVCISTAVDIFESSAVCAMIDHAVWANSVPEISSALKGLQTVHDSGALTEKCQHAFRHAMCHAFFRRCDEEVSPVVVQKPCLSFCEALNSDCTATEILSIEEQLTTVIIRSSDVADSDQPMPGPSTLAEYNEQVNNGNIDALLGCAVHVSQNHWATENCCCSRKYVVLFAAGNDWVKDGMNVKGIANLLRSQNFFEHHGFSQKDIISLAGDTRAYQYAVSKRSHLHHLSDASAIREKLSQKVQVDPSASAVAIGPIVSRKKKLIGSSLKRNARFDYELEGSDWDTFTWVLTGNRQALKEKCDAVQARFEKCFGDQEWKDGQFTRPVPSGCEPLIKEETKMRLEMLDEVKRCDPSILDQVTAELEMNLPEPRCEQRVIDAGPEDFVTVQMNAHGSQNAKLSIKKHPTDIKVDKHQFRQLLWTLSNGHYIRSMMFGLSACYSATVLNDCEVRTKCETKPLPFNVQVITSSSADLSSKNKEISTCHRVYSGSFFLSQWIVDTEARMKWAQRDETRYMASLESQCQSQWIMDQMESLETAVNDGSARTSAQCFNVLSVDEANSKNLPLHYLSDYIGRSDSSMVMAASSVDHMRRIGQDLTVEFSEKHQRQFNAKLDYLSKLDLPAKTVDNAMKEKYTLFDSILDYFLTKPAVDCTLLDDNLLQKELESSAELTRDVKALHQWLLWRSALEIESRFTNSAVVIGALHKLIQQTLNADDRKPFLTEEMLDQLPVSKFLPVVKAVMTRKLNHEIAPVSGFASRIRRAVEHGNAAMTSDTLLPVKHKAQHPTVRGGTMLAHPPAMVIKELEADDELIYDSDRLPILPKADATATIGKSAQNRRSDRLAVVAEDGTVSPVSPRVDSELNDHPVRVPVPKTSTGETVSGSLQRAQRDFETSPSSSATVETDPKPHTKQRKSKVKLPPISKRIVARELLQRVFQTRPVTYKRFFMILVEIADSLAKSCQVRLSTEFVSAVFQPLKTNMGLLPLGDTASTESEYNRYIQRSEQFNKLVETAIAARLSSAKIGSTSKSAADDNTAQD